MSTKLIISIVENFVMAKRKAKFRKNRKNGLIVPILAITFILCLTVVMLNVSSMSLQAKRDETNERIATLERQIEEQQKRKLELEEHERYTKTTKYVEEVAKEKLGLVYEDEIIFEPSSGN